MKLGRTDADAVGYELAELFEQQSLANLLLKNRNSHLEAALNLGGIAIHADERAAFVGGGQKLANTLGTLLIGNADTHALGLVFDFFLENELFQDLLRVKAFQLLGNLIALLDFRELLLDLGEADGLVANRGDRFGGSLAASPGHTRNKIEEHAARKKEYDRAQKYARAPLLPIIR